MVKAFFFSSIDLIRYKHEAVVPLSGKKSAYEIVALTILLIIHYWTTQQQQCALHFETIALARLYYYAQQQRYL